MSRKWPLFFILIISFLLTTDLIAQAPGNSDTLRQSKKEKTFATQFWTYLLSNNYKHWSPSPGKTGDYFASRYSKRKNSSAESPHGALLKTYVNRTAVSNTKTLPVGSVIILENYRVDKSLQSISVMYRTPGFNPEANDWYWINYEPDGSVSKSATVITSQPIATDAKGNQQTLTSTKPTSSIELMGRASSCIQCHKRCNGNDHVFFNDLDDRRTEDE